MEEQVEEAEAAVVEEVEVVEEEVEVVEEAEEEVAENLVEEKEEVSVMKNVALSLEQFSVQLVSYLDVDVLYSAYVNVNNDVNFSTKGLLLI
jgi:hypothetical protein